MGSDPIGMAVRRVDELKRIRAAAAVVIAGLVSGFAFGGCVGDSVENRPHGMTVDASGDVVALACADAGGIVAVELVGAESGPSDWDPPVLSLSSTDASARRNSVSLSSPTEGYRLQGAIEGSRLRVTVFKTSSHTPLLSTWTFDPSELRPGLVATDAGLVAEADWRQTC